MSGDSVQESCPDENRIAAMIQGFLDEESLRRVEDHIDVCPACTSLLAELAPLLAGGAQPADGAERHDGGLGRYRIMDTLGAGAMGVVYLAYDPRLKRNVALKLIRPELLARGDEPVRGRLLREARLLASLSHPNVLTIFDADATSDSIFLATEYVEGATLGQWVANTRPSWHAVVKVFIQAARGLSAAHRRGLIHRDIKPSNILVGTDGRARLTDFGLATSRPAEVDLALRRPDAASSTNLLSVEGAIVGTPAYMAPEQLAGQTANALSDQYAFCRTLLECLCSDGDGRTGPAPGSGGARTPEGREDWARHLQERQPSLPPALGRAIFRGLSLDPEARFRSMTELRGALERVLTGTARRKPPYALALSVIALFVGLAMAAYALWPGSRAPGPRAPEPGPAPARAAAPAPARPGLTPAPDSGLDADTDPARSRPLRLTTRRPPRPAAAKKKRNTATKRTPPAGPLGSVPENDGYGEARGGL